MPTRAEKREVIEAARKMGCRVFTNTIWFGDGRSYLVFRMLDEKHLISSMDEFSVTYRNEYEASLAFLKASLIND